ncbi:hypothetical protein CNMCM6106_004128 [Aspergillus hiratsukae]|uniref:Uncharacterized protein n=1 Tax=Aspergillus hiratsukae TaxID=1194566 RepID=A0A8H6UW60_9EURO|nr:hypothetical protein CNMCM6106_004128 [Aspergillus hiratsukae]
MPIGEAPQVLDDDELLAVLEEPSAKKMTRSGRSYGGKPVSSKDTSSARKAFQQSLAEAKERVDARAQKEYDSCTCKDTLSLLTMKILHTPPRYLTQDLVVTFLAKVKETEGLQMCVKHLQVIGTGLRLKTNLPPDVLDSHVKRCIELGDRYTTLRDEATSYTWFVGAKAPKTFLPSGRPH